MIKEYSEIGRYSLFLNYCINENDKAILKENGYKINVYPGR